MLAFPRKGETLPERVAAFGISTATARRQALLAGRRRGCAGAAGRGRARLRRAG